MLYVYTRSSAYISMHIWTCTRECVRERPDFILAYLPIVIVSIYFLKHLQTDKLHSWSLPPWNLEHKTTKYTPTSTTMKQNYCLRRNTHLWVATRLQCRWRSSVKTTLLRRRDQSRVRTTTRTEKQRQPRLTWCRRLQQSVVSGGTACRPSGR